MTCFDFFKVFFWGGKREIFLSFFSFPPRSFEQGEVGERQGLPRGSPRGRWPPAVPSEEAERDNKQRRSRLFLLPSLGSDSERATKQRAKKSTLFLLPRRRRRRRRPLRNKIIKNPKTLTLSVNASTINDVFPFGPYASYNVSAKSAPPAFSPAFLIFRSMISFGNAAAFAAARASRSFGLETGSLPPCLALAKISFPSLP